MQPGAGLAALLKEAYMQTSYVTISRRAFFALKITIVVLFVALCACGSYWYSVAAERRAWIEHRREFIEMYRSVQFELAGKTYCYEPRGNEVREAVYKGRGVFNTIQKGGR